MKRNASATLFLCLSISTILRAQSPNIVPLHVSSGTVLRFYLQSRASSDDPGLIDGLPKGTPLTVKILESIDSAINPDGSQFRGALAESLHSTAGIVIPAGTEVKGLLALLRSKRHPEGFRYELLITEVTVKGKKPSRLTASLNLSLIDDSASTNIRSEQDPYPGENSSSIHP